MDVTELGGGPYVLRLSATGLDGMVIVETVRSVNVDGEPKRGSFSLSFTDLAMPVNGVGRARRRWGGDKRAGTGAVGGWQRAVDNRQRCAGI